MHWTVTRASEATLVLCGNVGDSRHVLLHLLYFTYSWELGEIIPRVMHASLLRKSLLEVSVMCII